MFGDLDWPLNALHGLSAIAEFLIFFSNGRDSYIIDTSIGAKADRSQSTGRELRVASSGLLYLISRPPSSYSLHTSRPMCTLVFQCSIPMFLCLVRTLEDHDVCSTPIYKVPFVMPGAGSGVVRIDPLRFLARCLTRRPHQALSVLSLS